MRNNIRKRQILIVEDNEMNRDILCSLLEDEYDVLTAENGEEGLKVLAEHYKDISVIMLDVYMPVCDGFEFLARIRDDVFLSQVPVIVTTGSDCRDDEGRCLDLGASDFVMKPYNSRVVLGRVRSIIKLHESVTTLTAVEYDSLTGVLTMPAFYHYAEGMIRDEKDAKIDLVVADLKEFKLVNHSFGHQRCDDALKYIASLLSTISSEAIIGRKEDKFYCMFPHDNHNVEKEIADIRVKVLEGSPIPNLSIKYGYYPSVEKSQSISVLCDRVAMAASSIKDDYTSFFAIYDENISSKRVLEQQMEASFDDAIKNEEFVVWFQPKVDCKSERIEAAEALVRWKRSGADGYVSPGLFVPLFERDGLISVLDTYVFKAVCEYQKKRMDEGMQVFPISINLSRNSIYHRDTAKKYRDIVDEIGIPIELVPIELTESAAIGEYRILELAEELISVGFSLHMDDFGAGFSSLSSLSVLPFDVIKLDKSLIDQIGNHKGMIIVKHTIEIAHELGMQVVAEGVEDITQVQQLRTMGCDMIQGYYYSPPRDINNFEDYLKKDFEA